MGDDYTELLTGELLPHYRITLRRRVYSHWYGEYYLLPHYPATASSVNRVVLYRASGDQVTHLVPVRNIHDSVLLA